MMMMRGPRSDVFYSLGSDNSCFDGFVLLNVGKTETESQQNIM